MTTTTFNCHNTQWHNGLSIYYRWKALPYRLLDISIFHCAGVLHAFRPSASKFSNERRSPSRRSASENKKIKKHPVKTRFVEFAEYCWNNFRRDNVDMVKLRMEYNHAIAWCHYSYSTHVTKHIFFKTIRSSWIFQKIFYIYIYNLQWLLCCLIFFLYLFIRPIFFLFNFNIYIWSKRHSIMIMIKVNKLYWTGPILCFKQFEFR